MSTGIGDTFSNITYTDNKSSMDVSFNQPIGMSVNDDSMFHMIPKGSIVSIEPQDKYCNGDIVYYICEGIASVRKLYIKNDVFVLNALNSNYDPLIYDSDDIKILGKVSKVISSL